MVRPLQRKKGRGRLAVTGYEARQKANRYECDRQLPEAESCSLVLTSVLAARC